MASAEKILEEQNFASGMVSEQGRIIAAGILAFNWLFLSGSADAPGLLAAASPFWVLVSTAFAIFALLMDYIQYLSKYKMARDAYTLAEASPTKEAKFDYASSDYRWQVRAFHWKQWATLASFVALIIYLGIRILSGIEVKADSQITNADSPREATQADLRRESAPAVEPVRPSEDVAARYSFFQGLMRSRNADGGSGTTPALLLLDNLTGEVVECAIAPCVSESGSEAATQCGSVSRK